MKVGPRNNWRGRVWRAWLDGVEIDIAISFKTGPAGWVRVPLRDKHGEFLWRRGLAGWLMEWLHGSNCKTEVLRGIVFAQEQGKRAR